MINSPHSATNTSITGKGQVKRGGNLIFTGTTTSGTIPASTDGTLTFNSTNLSRSYNVYGVPEYKAQTYSQQFNLTDDSLTVDFADIITAYPDLFSNDLLAWERANQIRISIISDGPSSLSKVTLVGTGKTFDSEGTETGTFTNSKLAAWASSAGAGSSGVSNYVVTDVVGSNYREASFTLTGVGATIRGRGLTGNSYSSLKLNITNMNSVNRCIISVNIANYDPADASNVSLFGINAFINPNNINWYVGIGNWINAGSIGNSQTMAINTSGMIPVGTGDSRNIKYRFNRFSFLGNSPFYGTTYIPVSNGFNISPAVWPASGIGLNAGITNSGIGRGGSLYNQQPNTFLLQSPYNQNAEANIQAGQGLFTITVNAPTIYYK